MRISKALALVALFISAAALCLVGCGGQQGNSESGIPSNQAVKLSGAGASLPFPLYTKWIEQFKQVNPTVTVDYQSIGSGGGIRGITDRTIDFAGSDAPMSDEELSKAQGTIVHIPAALGSVVLAYNLPGKPVLNLDGETIADIFLGQIKNWNDPRLKDLNPGVNLPDRDIITVYRSDGSGTTYVFTDYLSSVSPAWKNGPGKGKSVQWSSGIGGKGNEGVSGQLTQIEGSIGYLELAYAIQNQIPFARIKNKEGNFVEPSVTSATAAAASIAASMPADLRVSIVNLPGSEVYPITSFTYLLAFKEQQDYAKGKALADFLWWAVHEGQLYSKDLLYAPLPDNIVQLIEPKIRELTFQGQPLLQD